MDEGQQGISFYNSVILTMCSLPILDDWTE